MNPPATRTQIAGAEAIGLALDAGEPVRLVLVERDDDSDHTRALVAKAKARGVEIWRGGAGDLRRMHRRAPETSALAMLGPALDCDLAGLIARGGAVWLLHRAAYPSNVGFAIRTAEVSGAAGVIVDGSFNHAARARVSHVSMGADRLLPVLWESTERTLELARARGHRIIALEDAGERPPWSLDLTGDLVFVVGSERDGIHPELLRRCDAVTALPMAGFVPSYNLQAAISAVALERLRQLEGAPGINR